MSSARTIAAVSLAAFATVATARADEMVSWSFDESTEGEDVFWTSPTALDTDAPRYELTYELAQIEATVQWTFITLTIDVTDQVPPELRTGTGIIDGPPPIVLFDDQLIFPEPPEPPALAADVSLSIDAGGFGQLAMTNIALGTTEVEIPPFGLQTVTILGFRVVGTLDGRTLGPAGDVNLDGNVDFADLLIILSSWGACPAPPALCPADTNGDGMVDFNDLLRVLSEWG